MKKQYIQIAAAIIAAFGIIGGYVAYSKYEANLERERVNARAIEEAKVKRNTPHWQYITSSKTDDYEGYFPPTDTTISGEDIKKIWIKRTTLNNQGYTKTNYSISCKYKTVSYDQIVTYDNKSNLTGDYSYPPVWQNAIPDTVFAGVVREVCKY